MHVAPGRRVSEENIELVEAAFDAWNRGESEAFAGHLAEDVAWLEVSGRPEGGSSDLFGRGRLRQSLESLFEAWESYHLEVERMHDLGDRVVAVVWEVALTGEGVEVDGRWGYVITVEEGLIVRIEAYRDAGQALRMAGVGESGIDA